MPRLRAHLRDRREFLKYSAAFLATPQFFDSSEFDVYPRNVNTNSKPSDLKITDLRVAIVVKPGPSPCPLIRIDTNQGVSGLGEVRDGAWRSARRRQSNVCAFSEEQVAWGKSASDRPFVSKDQAIWRSRAARWRSLRGGNGALGRRR